MAEASRIQKLLNEQNAEIDRLNFQISVIQGAAAHAQRSYEQHLAVYRQKLEEKPPIWHDDIQSLQERDAIMTDRIEKLEEQAHYANGVADLAMKHRDYAEQRVEKLEAALRKIMNLGQSAVPDHWEARCLARDTARKALERNSVD